MNEQRGDARIYAWIRAGCTDLFTVQLVVEPGLPTGADKTTYISYDTCTGEAGHAAQFFGQVRRSLSLTQTQAQTQTPRQTQTQTHNILLNQDCRKVGQVYLSRLSAFLNKK